jgi:hypothetical protein
MTSNSLSPEFSKTVSNALPAFVQRGLPSPFHDLLNDLEGKWRVHKEIYVATGSPERPARSSGMVTRRNWFVGTAKHLLDTTEGTVNGSPYYRLGVLGFSNVDGEYEWTTFDGLNSNMMLYRSEKLDKPTRKIAMTGVFTDQGLIDETTAGKQIAMRTVIDIKDRDHHTIDLYFTPPERREMLIEHTEYERTEK